MPPVPTMQLSFDTVFPASVEQGSSCRLAQPILEPNRWSGEWIKTCWVPHLDEQYGCSVLEGPEKALAGARTAGSNAKRKRIFD
jgi:hypothetical protein